MKLEAQATDTTPSYEVRQRVLTVLESEATQNALLKRVIAAETNINVGSMVFVDAKQVLSSAIEGLQMETFKHKVLTEPQNPQANCIAALQARVAELEAVLDFYACIDHYQTHNAVAPNVIQNDRGVKARVILGLGKK